MSLGDIISRGLAKSPISPEVQQQEVDATIAHLVDLLVKYADGPGCIGMRVQYLRAYLQKENGVTLAKKFGVSKQRACRAKKAMGDILRRAKGFTATGAITEKCNNGITNED